MLGLASDQVVTVSAALLTLGLLSCSSPLPAPSIDRVEPSRLSTHLGGVVDVHGANFLRGVTVWMDESTFEIRDEFTVRLSNGSEQRDVAVLGWAGPSLLTITLTKGLAVGLWDVSIVTPAGLSATLVQGLEVFDSTSACDDDLDGDGLIAASCGGPDCDDDPARCGAACGDEENSDGCDGYDNDCDGLVDEDPDRWFFRDQDGDGFGNAAEPTVSCEPPTGYVVADADCDDDPGGCGADCVPGSLEPDICDGMDQDCDGLLDEDAMLVWFADRDGDGHGDPNSVVSDCKKPAGYVADAGDCDDDPAACGGGCSPSSMAADICDGWDQDCDGLVDEDPERVWYRDQDGDLSGDSDSQLLACEAPQGYVASGGDCDDSKTGCGAACSPESILPDICDGFDTDCDGLTDEDSEMPAEWFFDGDGDGFGTPDQSFVGCAAPPGYVLAGGDCDDEADGGCGVDCYPGNPGVDTCDGWDQNCDGVVDDAPDILWWRDADLDGYPDPTTSVVACEAGSGWVQADLQAGSAVFDCDDADPAVIPGQACSDGHACTVDDVCDDGECEGTPIGCGEGVAIWSDGDEEPGAATWQMGGFVAEAAPGLIGDWTVVEGAASTQRNEVLLGGLVGKATRAMLYDNYVWTPCPLNDLGEQKHADRFTVVVRYETVSGDGVVFGFGDDTAHGVQWDGDTWSGFASTLELGGHPHHVAAASSPMTDEVVLAVTTNGHEHLALVWNGATFDEPTLLNSEAGGEGGGAVAFESLSGDGLVMFDTKDSAAIGWRVRQEGGFGAASMLAAPSGVFQSVEWLRAASDPKSDRVALGVLTQKEGETAVWFAVWGGSSWLSTAVGSTSLADAPVAPSVAVAFEGQGGALLAAWADDTHIHSKRWAADSGWTDVAPFQVGGSRVTTLSLRSSRSWDSLMLGILDNDEEVYFAPYQGAWGPALNVGSDSGEASLKPFAFVWAD